MRFFSKKTVTMAAVLVVAMGLVPSGAYAASAPEEDSYPEEPYINEEGFLFDPEYPFVDDESGRLESSTDQSSGGVSARGVRIEVNPYNCWGNTENVHQSGRFASLHARTYQCSKAPQQISTSAEIVKLGYFGVWHSLGSNNSTNSKGTVKVLDVNTKRVCSSTSLQTYRGNGYHRVQINGKSYVAQTSSKQESRIACDANRL